MPDRQWIQTLTRTVSVVLLGLGLATIPVPSAAQTIDFETIPGSQPSEGMTISTQFVATHGIEFQLLEGGAPVLAEVGRPTIAFKPRDTPSSDQGQFFLTDDGLLNDEAKTLVVLYSPLTDAASGVVLDIDFTEVFTIEARNVADEVVENVVIEAGDPNTGNKEATPWSIQRPTADIASIRFIGERDGGVFGLGFDDFDARGSGCSDGSPSSTTACLLDGRFQVTGVMYDFENPPFGPGNPFPLRVQKYQGVRAETNQSVSLYSFRDGNVELFLKMIDACGTASESFWVFAAGATTAEAEVTIVDTWTGAKYGIENGRNELFSTVADTQAFFTCGASPP